MGYSARLRPNPRNTVQIPNGGTSPADIGTADVGAGSLAGGDAIPLVIGAVVYLVTEKKIPAGEALPSDLPTPAEAEA